jgi:xanthine dehydrogenase small subunit
VDELKTVQEASGELYIGAGASLEAAWSALARRVPTLTDVWLRFASPPIRNAGTMGGNVANGSPIGDSPPILMALDAQIELRQGSRVRRMPLAEFYVDYMKNRLEPGEFVQGLVVPLAALQRQVRAYKISKRFDCDISAVCAGLAIELGGDKVKAVRLAFGGMAATVKRAAAAEAALVGQAWDEVAVERAQVALAQDFSPLTDMRASAGYRLQVAQNLVRRFWLETRGKDPLPASATSVFSVLPHITCEGV